MKTLAQRLTAAREAKSLSQSELARRIGVKPQAIQAIEAGKVEKPRNIVAIAKALDMDAGFLLTGDENAVLDLNEVPLVGYVGAGAAAHYYASADEGLGTAPAPEGATESTVAVEIRGDSLGSLFEHWLVYYDEVRSPVTHDMIGRLCVVGLIDDRVLVKKIQRSKSPGLFHLLSNTEDPIFDAEVVWAARVKSMMPR
ncbi:MAG: helix-turn-helix transcriptional regulator [Pseudaminobacter sp.]